VVRLRPTAQLMPLPLFGFGGALLAGLGLTLFGRGRRRFVGAGVGACGLLAAAALPPGPGAAAATLVATLPGLALSWASARGVLRVLLILPWAVPNYITALLWKGMFHQQYGAVNAMLSALGLARVSWFSSFAPAFTANVVTNTWLGFPFMMVICLGALQSIPR